MPDNRTGKAALIISGRRHTQEPWVAWVMGYEDAVCYNPVSERLAIEALRREMADRYPEVELPPEEWRTGWIDD